MSKGLQQKMTGVGDSAYPFKEGPAGYIMLKDHVSGKISCYRASVI